MKKVLSVLLAALLLLSLAAPAFAAGAQEISVYSSYRIPGGSMRMTAHRGYSSVAPENTLPAFRMAGEYGFWGAECDISTTADGVWIIMHDETVDRMTDGTGRVADLTYEEICALTVDTGSNIEQYPNTKVPTLTEYLDVCREYGMHPVIEINECAAVADLDSLAALLSAREEKEMFTVITFGREHAVRIKELLPDTPVYLIVTFDATWEDIGFCREHNLDGLDFVYVLDDALIKIFMESGLKTMVWTVDDIENADRLYELGVRDITTNVLTQNPPQGTILQRVIWLFKDLFAGLRELFSFHIDFGGNC